MTPFRVKGLTKARNTFTLVLLSGLCYLTACSEEEHITEVDFQQEEFAHFVEPDFPFITTSLDARDLGPAFPSDNLTPRCLAVQLGHEAYACFDTDLLRWSAAWTGDFLPMVTMGQISYHDFHTKDNQIPTLSGEARLATGLYPGWTGSRSAFTDPRLSAGAGDQGPPWGPPADSLIRWNGLYVADQDVIFSYTVKNTDIYEMPGSLVEEGETGFTRTFSTDRLEEALTLVAADVANGTQSETDGNIAYIYSESNPGTVTAVGLAGSGAELRITDNRYASIHLDSGREAGTFTVVAWRGPVAGKEHFENMLSRTRNMPDFKNGGPVRWPETVKTTGKVAPDTSAWVIDEFTLPVPNPWNRNVRIVDMKFFSDNRAAAVTFEGDVWLIDGIDKSLRSLSWSRFASGLYEPQSIEIVDDEIFVYGREGIVRLHDLNGDGSADYYENFSNLMAQSIESREWPTDMVAAPDGGFYVSKGAALDMGPPGGEAVAQGMRRGSPHSGSILKVSADGRNIKHFATGFRGPYMGIHPQTGMLTASDQQGHHVPSTPLLHVQEGDYYGVSATAHRDPVPEITPPLTWIPHNVDRSGISQAWVTGDRMGPLNGNLLHFSYGLPGIFRVYIDSTGNTMQGGVSLLPGTYPAPAMKGVMNQEDGQLYVSGFNLWGTSSDGYSSIIRLRYTGLPSTLPEMVRARKGGVIIDFDVELDPQTAEDVQNFRVERWNYQRTGQYGSGHFQLDGSPGQEYLAVTSAHVSEDGKGVLLAVPNIAEVMQMQIGYKLRTAGGKLIDGQVYFTVNEVIETDFEAEGYPGAGDYIMAEGVLAGHDEASEPATAERGRQLYQRIGCMACHSTDGATAGLNGPTFKGLFGSERPLSDGSTAVADEQYIRTALLQPGAITVEGYDQGMPSFNGILSDDEIESITLYIKTLTE